MLKNIFGLKRINDYLTVVLVIIILYILLAPLLPQVSFWVKSKATNTEDTVSAVEGKKENIPSENMLVIPSMYLKEEIHEGAYADTLSKGVWRRPHTSTPEQGGNTVLAGHRFTYHGQAVFYHLDKVSLGDSIVIFWNGAKYEYKVNNIQEVSPNAVEIEKDTDTPLLTIYTCTPLWTVERRLVIQAQLVEQGS
jgi:LPXTG-site transpeptidase (sortase) family protein